MSFFHPSFIAAYPLQHHEGPEKGSEQPRIWCQLIAGHTHKRTHMHICIRVFVGIVHSLLWATLIPTMTKKWSPQCQGSRIMGTLGLHNVIYTYSYSAMNYCSCIAFIGFKLKQKYSSKGLWKTLMGRKTADLCAEIPRRIKEALIWFCSVKL